MTRAALQWYDGGDTASGKMITRLEMSRERWDCGNLSREVHSCLVRPIEASSGFDRDRTSKTRC